MSNNLMEASAQWATRPQDERFQTLEALRESVHGRRLRSRSIDVDCGKTKVAEQDGKLLINGTLTACEPSHWSFGQLSTLVKAPGAYLRTLPKPLIVECLNHGLQNSGRETVKFMTVANENPDRLNTLQAVTSPTYGRIWDADCVDAVMRIVERSGGRFHNPKAYSNGFGSAPVPSGLYASDRDVFMFLIDGGSMFDAGPRAQLNRGFFVKNSEVGAATFELTTFLFNVVCGNHIVWGARDVNKVSIRHTSGGPTRFDREVMPCLLDYANSSIAPIESAVHKAQGLVIGDTRETVSEWINKHGKFSRAEVSQALDSAKREEGDWRTLWQVVQGFTAYARGFDYVDARVDLETRAGALLNVLN